MGVSWTARFLVKWWPEIGLQSALRLRGIVMPRNLPQARDDAELVLRRPPGARVQLRAEGTDVYTFVSIFGDGLYDQVVARLGRCRSILDLGANVGFATLRFAALLPGCHIVAVEPSESNFAQLCRNVQVLVRSGACQPLRAAVWCADTDLVIDNPGEGCTSFRVRAATARDAGDSMVPGKTMASLLDATGFDHVDLVKMDIEGAETNVFQGDLAWLDRVRALAIEFHGNSRDDSRFDNIMNQRGFRVQDLNPHTTFASR